MTDAPRDTGAPEPSAWIYEDDYSMIRTPFYTLEAAREIIARELEEGAERIEGDRRQPLYRIARARQLRAAAFVRSKGKP